MAAGRKMLSVEYQPEHAKTVLELTANEGRLAIALDAGETRVLKVQSLRLKRKYLYIIIFQELMQYSIPYLYSFHSVLEADP